MSELKARSPAFAAVAALLAMVLALAGCGGPAPAEAPPPLDPSAGPAAPDDPGDPEAGRVPARQRPRLCRPGRQGRDRPDPAHPQGRRRGRVPPAAALGEPDAVPDRPGPAHRHRRHLAEGPAAPAAQRLQRLGPARPGPGPAGDPRGRGRPLLAHGQPAAEPPQGPLLPGRGRDRGHAHPDRPVLRDREAQAPADLGQRLRRLGPRPLRLLRGPPDLRDRRRPDRPARDLPSGEARPAGVQRLCPHGQRDHQPPGRDAAPGHPGHHPGCSSLGACG